VEEFHVVEKADGERSSESLRQCNKTLLLITQFAQNNVAHIHVPLSRSAAQEPEKPAPPGYSHWNGRLLASNRGTYQG
jgi:hypothetical protein